MRYLLAAAALAALPLTPAAASPASFNGAYGQNFDALGPTGTTLTTLGSGEWTVWRFAPAGAGWNGPTWNDSTGIPAIDMAQGTMVIDTNTSQSSQAPLGLYYNPNFPTFTRFGGVNAGGSTNQQDPDRSLGTSPTGAAGIGLQLALTNATGGTLNSVAISYDTTILSLQTISELAGYRFFYSLTGETGTWFAAPGLDTITASNAPIFTNYLTTGVLNLGGGGWTSGSQLLLRWVDDNDQAVSPDQMMAIDNVTVTANATPPVPEPATWAMMIAGFGFVGASMRRRRVAFA